MGIVSVMPNLRTLLLLIINCMCVIASLRFLFVYDLHIFGQIINILFHLRHRDITNLDGMASEINTQPLMYNLEMLLKNSFK